MGLTTAFADETCASEQIDQKWAPWNDAGRRIGSLYEMLTNYARKFINAIDLFDKLESDIVAHVDRETRRGKLAPSLYPRVQSLALDQVLSAGGSKQQVRVILKSIDQLCKDTELVTASAKIGRLIDRLERPISPDETLSEISEIRSRIKDDLEAKLFFYVSQWASDLYQRPELFGKEVGDRFPEAARDIEEAGKCLALGRDTACVMHLMRVLEIGVRAFAKRLRVKNLKRPMGDLLTDLDKKINPPRPQRPPAGQPQPPQRKISARQRQRNDAYGQLWKDLNPMRKERNSVMHPENFYTPEQARLRYDNTKAFMQGLIEILK